MYESDWSNRKRMLDPDIVVNLPIVQLTGRELWMIYVYVMFAYQWFWINTCVWTVLFCVVVYVCHWSAILAFVSYYYSFCVLLSDFYDYEKTTHILRMECLRVQFAPFFFFSLLCSSWGRVVLTRSNGDQHRSLYSWIDRQTDRKIYSYIDRWTDRQIDRHTYTIISSSSGTVPVWFYSLAMTTYPWIRRSVHSIN